MRKHYLLGGSAAVVALAACLGSNPPDVKPTPAPTAAPPAASSAPAVETKAPKGKPDFSLLGKFPESRAKARAWLKSPPEPLSPRTPTKIEKTAAGVQVQYSIGYWFMGMVMYPTQSSLPDAYTSFYPDPIQTIQSFTLQSLQRDGFNDAQVTVELSANGFSSEFLITVSSQNPAVQGYATVHPAFLDDNHGAQSFMGSIQCMQCETCSTCGLCTTSSDPKCWDPAPVSGQPWAMFLPLGLPMLNQQTTLFLDYPPIPALTVQNPNGSHGDYLNNFTMCRWGRVLNAAGANNPYVYETIVDSRPIAAPGSGQDAHLPIPQATYNNATTGGLYINPMLQLLTNPVGALSSGTMPIAVFGYTARQTWGQIIGSPTPSVLQVGTTNLGGQQQSTAWISTNHPDVTSYNCCSQDKTCGTSTSLVPDEQIDFVTACWMQSMAANPAQDPNAAKTACASQWQPPTAGANALTQCIQEKLDNDNQNAVCCNWQEAWAYCTQNNNNACASLDCKVDSKILAKAPPTPPWQQNTCNTFRFFPGSAYCNRCGGCSSSLTQEVRRPGEPRPSTKKNDAGKGDKKPAAAPKKK